MLVCFEQSCSCSPLGSEPYVSGSIDLPSCAKKVPSLAFLSIFPQMKLKVFFFLYLLAFDLTVCTLQKKKKNQTMVHFDLKCPNFNQMSQLLFISPFSQNDVDVKLERSRRIKWGLL